jgi:hypothetical protein
MSNLIPYSPKLADLTLSEVQNAWIVDANEDYRAIVEAECRGVPTYQPSTYQPTTQQRPTSHKPERLPLYLSLGAFGIAGLGVAFLAGSMSKPTPPPQPAPAPTPIIVVPPANRCIAFCSGG